MRRSSPWLITAMIVLAAAAGLSRAEGPAAKSAPSLQEQIDALKAGQERILEELQAIRALLEEKSPRSEYGARSASPSAPPSPVTLNVHGESFKGDARATVAIVEYSDFECDFCARYAKEILPQIMETYVKSGRVKYFFRDLPEPAHPHGLFKARVARCAGEQGRFWEMHDWLFALTPGNTTLTVDNVGPAAQAVGLDATKLTACLHEERYAENIRRSAAGAARMGIQGTPTFVIGALTDDGDVVRVKKVMVGAENIGAFKEVIDELLAAAPPK